MYEQIMPKIPGLHKCHYCGKRLKRNMLTVAKWTWYWDGGACDWYCSEECARNERQMERDREQNNEELTLRIIGDEK